MVCAGLWGLILSLGLSLHFVAFWDEESPKGIKGILGCHGKLCGQVEERMRLLDEIDRAEIEPFTEWHEYFELGLSFRSVVIVIDKEDWERDGVLLVRTSYPERSGKMAD